MLILQLIVKTYDPATPTRFAIQDYNITVLRNENGPRFNVQDPYFVEIPDDSQYGRVVVQLNATDDDGVSSYTVILIPV